MTGFLQFVVAVNKNDSGVIKKPNLKTTKQLLRLLLNKIISITFLQKQKQKKGKKEKE